LISEIIKRQNAKLGIKDCLGLFLNLMKLNDEVIAATWLQNEQKKIQYLKKFNSCSRKCSTHVKDYKGKIFSQC
jgi:hypothetical protein